MRDFTSCFSDHAVKVSDASCSGNSSPPTDQPSIQFATSLLFKSKLVSSSSLINNLDHPLLINLTWSRTRNHSSPTALSISFPEFLHSSKPTFLTKKKGAHYSFLASSLSITLHWDFSSANFAQGPDPVNNFYVALIINNLEFALLLGDQIAQLFDDNKLPVADFSMICRTEQVAAGRTLHSITRARFGDGDKSADHEITIRCRGAAGGLSDGKDAELFVFVDNKRVVHVAKLNLNFRGNQTIFVDGSPVDVMWDMYGWCFGGLVGQSVFMFRKRSSVESRLWLEEQGTLGFSLIIQAFRSP